MFALKNQVQPKSFIGNTDQVFVNGILMNICISANVSHYTPFRALYYSSENTSLNPSVINNFCSLISCPTTESTINSQQNLPGYTKISTVE